MRKALFILLFAVVAGFGIAGCQNYENGLYGLCHGPETCPQCANAAPEDRQRLMAQHLDSIIRNERVRALFESLDGMSPEERVLALNAASGEAGFSSCPLAHFYRRVTQPVSPVADDP
jgi:hypothetical protein